MGCCSYATDPLCRVQGDVNDTLAVMLCGVVDLSGATAVETHVWRMGLPGATLVTAITDPIARTAQVELSPWLADAHPGLWKFEVQVTFGDGTVLTWPSCDPPELRVRAQGA